MIQINCGKTRAIMSWTHYSEATTQMPSVQKRHTQIYCAIYDIILALKVPLPIQMKHEDSGFVGCYTVQCIILPGPTNTWRWRCYIPLKCQDKLNYPLQSVTSQKTRILNKMLCKPQILQSEKYYLKFKNKMQKYGNR